MSKFERKGGGTELLLKRVKTPGTVDVGIIDAGPHESGDRTVAQIAFDNEYGTETIPERSFMRSTTKGKKKEIISLQKKLLIKIQSGEMTTEQALGIIGEFVASEMKQKMVDLKEPPNAPSTIKRKGSSNPLIDTSQTKNAITYEVHKK